MTKRVLIFIVAAVVAACAACSDSKHDRESSPEPKTILVTGATGTQGGAVARELLGRGYDVRALTRRPKSQRASALAELGITVVKGDFDDAMSLAAAMQGVNGVFAVTNFWEHGYDKEIAHGRQLIDAAKRAGVEHFVFTSIAAAETNTGLPHFDTKYEIEKVLYDSGLNYSIVRPVEFMDNIYFAKEQVMAGILADPRDSDQRHQWIAARDIGFFVGEMFDDPDRWRGQAINIAGDEITVGEYAKLLSECLGVEVRHQQISWEEFEAALGEEMTHMYHWFVEPGFHIDIATLRDTYPKLTTMRDYLDGLGWSTQ